MKWVKAKRVTYFIFSLCLFIYAFFISRVFLVRNNRPNVLLITIDALRPDHLGCYGYKRNTSQHIDALAAEGAVFTETIAQSSHTAPSVISMITSTYPQKHRVKDWGYQLDENIKTLPELLKRAGYATAFISNQIALSLIKSFRNGFDTFKMLKYDTSKTEKQNGWVTDQAIRWLRADRNKKFFLWVYYLGPHGPYIPPSPYDTIFVEDAQYIKKYVPISGEDEQFAVNKIPKYVARQNIDNVGYYISQYDGEICSTDSEIGRLLSELRALHLEENTVVVLTADHGEAMGEHDLYFCHSTFLYDELIRVPLIITLPEKRQYHEVIDTQTRTIDIMPTILDVVGIPHYNFLMRGESLLRLLHGRTHRFPQFAYSEFGDRSSLRTKEWKLIYTAGDNGYELYHLKNDPKELTNVALRENEILEYLKKQLKKSMTRSKDADAFERKMTYQQLKDQLRSLGYVQ